jgi:primosomal protein N' (replication factor Y)
MSTPLFDGLPPLPGEDEGDARIVRIALPVPIDRLFDYRLPARLSARLSARQTLAVAPGTRVRVPFSGQSLTGLVVPCDLSTAEENGPARPIAEHASGALDETNVDPARPRARRELAEIEAVVDEEPVVSETMMRILGDAAREIFCPIGLALAHALPPGAAPRVARPWALTWRGERALAQRAMAAHALGGEGRPLLEHLAARPATRAALARAFPRVDVDARLASLARDGLVERRIEHHGPRARIPHERFVRLAPDLDLRDACDRLLARADRQAALLRRIAAAEQEGLPTRALTRSDAGAASLLRALARRKLVVFEQRPRLEAPDDFLDGGDAVELTEDQALALRPIRDAIKRQVAETFLLHGVTGSGKTEVYLRALAETRTAGRQALVLVPEITLTHQIVARVRARFGDQVAILHSGLKPGERLAQWERLRTGQTAIAIGARSALFAPLEALGLIVIDEEHDGAYKNDEGFRYHTRELAERIARQAACPLILGSATPSLETRHRADRGEIARLSLPRRVGGRPLPAVEIVDLAKEKERNPRGRKAILSRPLRRAIEEALAAGGQTILFLNRRGFSTRIFCFQCGHAERCDDCDVALVYHATENQLRCHYCDLVRDVPEQCGGCGDPETALLGVGTERLEEETRALFPTARTMRLDRDVAARRGYTEKVLRALKHGDVDIVIGTQMVAKGHDFPGVQLVGVVAADLGLHLPDFRAAERTFQLLTQVAGRAGRAQRPGRVVVQTFVPDHYAIAPVASHDFEGFYREEIQHRESLGYPPFGLLTRIVVHAEDEAEAREAAERLALAAREALAAHLSAQPGSAAQPTHPASAAYPAYPEQPAHPPHPATGPGLEILGPAPAPIARLRGRFRFMLLLKGSDAALLRRVTEHLLAAARPLPRSVQVALDARPFNML